MLTSTEATEMGRYVVGESHTAFTAALLAAVRPGDGAEVRLGDLYKPIRQTLEGRKLPLPRCRSDDTSGDLVIRRARAANCDVNTDAGAAAGQVTDRGRGRALLGAGAVALLMVAGVVAVLLNVGGVGETATPSTAPSSDTAVIFSDDFSGRALDPQKWQAPEASGVVGQSSGHLRFVVRPGAEINTSLEPMPLARPFQQMTFDISIPQYAKAGKGGVALIVNPRSDRPQWLAFGPTPEGRTIYPLICAKAKCTNGVYGDFVEMIGPAVPKFAANEVVPVKLVRADGHLRFYVRDMLVGETPTDPGPLTDFRFAISAGDTESWDIEVDNIVCR